MCILNSRIWKDIPKQNVYSQQQNIERYTIKKCLFTTAEHGKIPHNKMRIQNSRT